MSISIVWYEILISKTTMFTAYDHNFFLEHPLWRIDKLQHLLLCSLYCDTISFDTFLTFTVKRHWMKELTKLYSKCLISETGFSWILQIYWSLYFRFTNANPALSTSVTGRMQKPRRSPTSWLREGCWPPYPNMKTGKSGWASLLYVYYTDRQTDSLSLDCSYTDRVAVLPLHTDTGSGTRLSPLTQTDRHTDCHEPVPSQTRQATCPPTQEDVGLAQDFLLLQRQTVRDFSTLLPWLLWQTLEWLLERLPFTSTVRSENWRLCFLLKISFCW